MAYQSGWMADMLIGLIRCFLWGVWSLIQAMILLIACLIDLATQRR